MKSICKSPEATASSYGRKLLLIPMMYCIVREADLPVDILQSTLFVTSFPGHIYIVRSQTRLRAHVFCYDQSLGGS